MRRLEASVANVRQAMPGSIAIKFYALLLAFMEIAPPLMFARASPFGKDLDANLLFVALNVLLTRVCAFLIISANASMAFLEIDVNM